MSDSKSARKQLQEFLSAHTAQYRKGPAVVEHGSTVEVYAMPAAEEAETEPIDVGFIKIVVTAKDGDKDTFVELLKAALKEPGTYAELSAQRLLRGPSYIEVGAWIGDQSLALCLFTVMQHFGLGTVITPATLGATGEMATQMMGRGFIMIAPNEELSVVLLGAPVGN